MESKIKLLEATVNDNVNIQQLQQSVLFLLKTPSFVKNPEYLSSSLKQQVEVLFTKEMLMASHPMQEQMQEWYSIIYIASLQSMTKLFDIIAKQSLVLRSYETYIKKARELVSDKGYTPIEQHFMINSYPELTDKIQTYVDFIKQQIKLQFEKHHAFELMAEQNETECQ